MRSMSGFQGRAVHPCTALAVSLALALSFSASGVRAAMRFDLPQQDINARDDYPRSVIAVDLDRDGDLDLMTGDGSSGQPAGLMHAIMAWRNDGTPFSGSWTGYVVYSSMFVDPFLATGDLDGDRWPDLIVSSSDRDAAAGNPTGHSNILALRNDGTPFDGTWTSATVAAFTGDDYCGQVGIGDLDGDGWLDVAVAVDGSGVWIYRNDGTPFTDPWAGNILQTWPTRWGRGVSVWPTSTGTATPTSRSVRGNTSWPCWVMTGRHSTVGGPIASLAIPATVALATSPLPISMAMAIPTSQPPSHTSRQQPSTCGAAMAPRSTAAGHSTPSPTPQCRRRRQAISTWMAIWILPRAPSNRRTSRSSPGRTTGPHSMARFLNTISVHWVVGALATMPSPISMAMATSTSHS